jgi:DNA-binding response OmpR family regulator
VLCVDNDHDILDGMRALLTRWSVRVDTASRASTTPWLAVRAQRPGVLLVDYHLTTASTVWWYPACILRDANSRHDSPPGALLTADGSDELARRARGENIPLLQKPVRPAALRALLAALARRTSVARQPERATPPPVQ